LKNFEEAFPLFAKVRNVYHPLFSLPEPLDVSDTVAQGTPHTAKSIQEKTGVVHYDAWRDITQKYGGELGVEMLTEQREK